MMKKSTILLISLLSISFICSPLKAKDNIVFSPEELQWIADNPEIRLGYDPNWPPFEWHDEAKGFVGLSSEYIDYIEEMSGLNIIPVRSSNWNSVMVGLREGSLDMVASINPSEARRQFLNFTEPYFSPPNVYVTRRGEALSGGLSAYRDLKVGVGRGFHVEQFLRENYAALELVSFDNVEEGLMALAVGEISAYAGSLAVISFLIENKGILGLEVAGEIEELEHLEICMASRKELMPLITIVDKIMNSLPESKRNVFNRSWMSLDAVKSTTLTTEEEQWIATHPVVQCAINDSPPYHYWDNGPAGVSIEVLRQISEKYGFAVEYQKDCSLSDALSFMKSREVIDMLPIVENTVERREMMMFSDNFADDDIVIYTPESTEGIFSLSDLKGKTIAMPMGYALIKRLQESELGIILEEYPTRLECLEAVHNEEVDAYVGNLMVGRYLMLHNGLDNVKVAAPSIWAPQRFAFGVRKDHAILVSILNKGLAGISQDEFAAMYLKYYTSTPDRRSFKYVLIASLLALLTIGFILLLNWQLRKRVAIRTKELNDALRLRETAESQLQEHNGKLEEEVEQQVSAIKRANIVTQKALKIAHAGTWFYDTEISADSYTFSAELFDILGESSFDKQGPIPIDYWHENLLKTNVEVGAKALAFVNDLMTNPDLEPHLIFQYTRPIDGRVIWLEASAEVERDVHGHIIRMNGLTRDITTEKMVEEELVRANALSQTAVSLAESGTWFVDYADEDYYQASDDDVKIKGLLPSKNNKYHVIDDWYKHLCAADEELAQKTIAQYHDAIEGISELDITYLFKRPLDGKLVWLREKAEMVRDDYGNNLFMYGVTQDVTKHTRQDIRKEQQLQRQRITQETAKIGSWYIDAAVDPERFVSDANLISIQGEDVTNPTTLTGWGKNLIKSGGEEGRKVFEAAKVAIADPEVMEWDAVIQYTRPTDQQKIWLKVKAVFRRNDSGVPIYIQGISQDVTEQKLQDVKVQESQHRLQSLFDNMPNGFAEHEIILDEKGEPVDYRFLFTNPAFEQQTGLDSSVIGKTIREVAPGLESIWIERYGKVALTGEANTFEEYSEAFKRHYRIYAFSHRKGHFAVLFNDITKVYEQQQEIKTINEVLAYAQTVAGVGHFEYYPMEDKVKCSKEYFKIFEIEPNEITGMDSFLSFMHADDVTTVVDAMANAIAKQIPLEMTFRIHGENGIKYIHEQGEYKFDDEGNAIYFMGTAQDITDLKKAETKMEEQHHFLQTLLNSMPDFIFAKDLNGVFSLANHQFEEYIGKKAGMIIGKTDDEIFNKEQANINRQMDQVVYKEGRNITYEEMLLHHNGKELLYEKIKTPIVDNEGKVIGIIGMGRDITEKRKSEVEILNKEKSFRNLFEQSNDAILIIDILENAFLDCNNALIKLVGLASKEELCKMPLAGFSPEFQPGGIRSDRVIEDSLTSTLTLGFARLQYDLVNQRTGELISCNLSFNKTEFKNRKVIQVIVRDITELKEAENVLKNSKKHIEEILNTIPVGIAVVNNATGEYILMNNTIKNMLEINTSEVVHFDDSIIYENESDQVEVREELESKGVLVNKELELVRTKSSQRFWAQVTSSRREYFDTEATLVCLYDTTQLKNTQIALETAKHAAEAANIAKSAFLANMSHEIRTPMNAIIGFSEILNRKVVDEEQRRHLSSIQTSGKTLLKLINNILDLSKIEAGKMDLLYDFIDIKQLVNDVDLLFSSKASEKGLTFEAIVHEDFPRSIEVDELRLRQVVINLLGNAIKFTKTGFVKVLFSVENQIDEKVTLVIEVSDSGIGIAKSKIDEIFNDFTQEDSSTTRNFGGTGLGLSISKNIVKLFGGDLSAHSEVNDGATFTVRIPDIKCSDERFLLHELEGVDPTTVVFAPAKLLIVDDVMSNRDVLQSHLDIYNFDIFFASNGKEGVEMAKEVQPDLILMDMRMPVMDGYEATRRIVANEGTKHVPIVACTASAFKTAEEEMLQFGFAGYLRKPVLVRSLVSELTKHLKFQQLAVDIEHQEGGAIKLMASQKNQLPDVIKELEQIREEYWLPIEKSKNMRKVKAFGDALQQFNEAYSFEHIDYYVVAISMAVKSFDVADVKALVAKFPMMIRQMDELV